MIVPFILALCLAGVFCLVPLAMYLFWLARLARRSRPTAVSGPWDFVGVLIGLSGFILFGGGLLLTLVQANFRYWMRGNFEGLRNAWGQEHLTWTLLVGMYFLVVGGLSALVLAARRRWLVVYNIDPAAFEEAAASVLRRLVHQVRRTGKLWTGADGPLFELDDFEGGRTVTLRWVSPDVRLFEEVVRQLRPSLAGLQTDENPAARWLMSAAVGGAILAGCFFGLLAYALSLVG